MVTNLEHVLHVQLYEFIMAVLQEGKANTEDYLPPLDEVDIHDPKHHV